MDNLKILKQKIETRIESLRNKEIKKLWKERIGDDDEWHGFPRSSSEVDTIPFTVELEIGLWSKILKFKVKEFYTNPKCYLENALKMKIYRFDEFQDFTPVENVIRIWLGTSFESSLCGGNTIYMDDQAPWPGVDPLINRYEDLDRLEPPDFKKSGLMPLALKMYNEIGELIGEDYNVIFPCWRRSPFGVACYLRGFENLLIDMLEKPAFVHKLMRFITDAREKWVTDRAKYLNRTVGKGDLDDDEVNTPTVSPEQYEEFILPYEQELCEFHGGISYWHSCGDTGRLLNLIRRIPQIDIFHIGPVTNYKITRGLFGNSVAFEKCLMPTMDIQLASESRMGAILEEIKNALDGTSYTVRADGLDVISSVQEELNTIKKWIDIAERKLNTE